MFPTVTAAIFKSENVCGEVLIYVWCYVAFWQELRFNIVIVYGLQPILFIYTPE